MRRLLSLTIVGLFALLAFNPTLAATFTTAAAGNWQSSATWVGGSIPDPENINGNDIIINHDVTVVNNNVKVNNYGSLTVNGVAFTMQNGALTSSQHSKVAACNVA